MVHTTVSGETCCSLTSGYEPTTLAKSNHMVTCGIYVNINWQDIALLA